MFFQRVLSAFPAETAQPQLTARALENFQLLHRNCHPQPQPFPIRRWNSLSRSSSSSFITSSQSQSWNYFVPFSKSFSTALNRKKKKLSHRHPKFSFVDVEGLPLSISISKRSFSRSPSTTSVFSELHLSSSNLQQAEQQTKESVESERKGEEERIRQRIELELEDQKSKTIRTSSNKSKKMTKHERVFEGGNDKYSSSFPPEHGILPTPPSKKLIVLTCMDSRIDPLPALGLNLGEAHVIRNAGGRAVDAVRSIVISQRMLGTVEIAVIHHTGCGLLSTTSDSVKSHITKNSPSLLSPTQNPGASSALNALAILPLGDSLEQSVTEDVEFLKWHPLIVKDGEGGEGGSGGGITGWIYECESGKLKRVC